MDSNELMAHGKIMENNPSFDSTHELRGPVHDTAPGSGGVSPSELW
jgi:hypothetical protein